MGRGGNDLGGPWHQESRELLQARALIRAGATRWRCSH
jgi:hypothetical protein